MAHSQARELVTQGYTATLVSNTLKISRSSLYYRKRPPCSRADRTYDEQIVAACGEKTSYGYRRIARCMYRRRQSGWMRAAAWAASTSKKRNNELPCLLMCPKRCLPALESSLGINPT